MEPSHASPEKKRNRRFQFWKPSSLGSMLNLGSVFCPEFSPKKGCYIRWAHFSPKTIHLNRLNINKLSHGIGGHPGCSCRDARECGQVADSHLERIWKVGRTHPIQKGFWRTFGLRLVWDGRTLFHSMQLGSRNTQEESFFSPEGRPPQTLKQILFQ